MAEKKQKFNSTTTVQAATHPPHQHDYHRYHPPHYQPKQHQPSVGQAGHLLTENQLVTQQQPMTPQPFVHTPQQLLSLNPTQQRVHINMNMNMNMNMNPPLVNRYPYQSPSQSQPLSQPQYHHHHQHQQHQYQYQYQQQQQQLLRNQQAFGFQQQMKMKQAQQQQQQQRWHPHILTNLQTVVGKPHITNSLENDKPISSHKRAIKVNISHSDSQYPRRDQRCSTSNKRSRMDSSSLRPASTPSPSTAPSDGKEEVQEQQDSTDITAKAQTREPPKTAKSAKSAKTATVTKTARTSSNEAGFAKTSVSQSQQQLHSSSTTGKLPNILSSSFTSSSSSSSPSQSSYSTQTIGMEETEKSSDTAAHAYVCKTCRLPTTSVEGITEHANLHTKPGSSRYFCAASKCTKNFKTLEGLRLHVLNHHANGKKHTCQHPGCDRAFARKCDLNLHRMRQHQIVRPFQCNVHGCSRSFVSRAELRRHSRNHGFATTE